ncbi:MAG: S-methyl-5-thioribose-1-phosphate isomerase [Desulfobacterium sp.]|nr:S-methyl-5-thioribose-1-phosphate isomerase [Desulfobacterium sp.]MBU3946979.1 S-methyl-5-thioribose-1-phosphate isomerase [Pseudomonadota bacterium]MBU4010554.1 S-methyl-5-thioribose-1-phosphate isomerase [Pseudomonadota bacterium]MBU4036834.1 S-methyl-5-thioribose-1-phosphate isomerase [Pseudomonadota bacterium]
MINPNIVQKKSLRPIWLDDSQDTVKIIDQRLLPHKLVIVDLKTSDDVITAIKDMYVRGAPLIGVTAAFGVYLSVLSLLNNQAEDDFIIEECSRIKAARPTAINLAWAADRVLKRVLAVSDIQNKIIAARDEASIIAEEEVKNCKDIGLHGLEIIETISRNKNNATVNILTHCNAGWLACIEYGTATAPVYAAHEKGIDIHVWVDETRPLNQGARLTAWELGKSGVKHTIITDNAGGHLMQNGMVDMVIVGTDRTTYKGDVANKIGTYLKALAAKDNKIPFYVALPSSTIDWETDSIKDMPIELRDPDEVRYVQGLDNDVIKSVLVTPKDSPAANFAFDVTPSRLVTGFITERGICNAENINELFPDKIKMKNSLKEHEL